MYTPSVDGVNPGPSGCGQCLGAGASNGSSGGSGYTPSTLGAAIHAADPVDVGSGLLVLNAVDLSVSGSLGSLSIPRVYRTLSTNSGAFGLGSETPYNYELDTYNPQAAKAINLIAPDGNRYLFSQQANGTFTDSSDPWLQGAVLTATGPYPTNGTANVANLKFKDGTIWTFQVTEIDLDGPAGCNYEFSALGAITDRNGNQTTLTRNCLQISALTDPVGRQLTMTYNSNNSITSITDPIGRTVRYTYNTSGTLATVTDPNGGVTTYQYDTQNRMTSMTDPRGVIMFQNSFGSDGRVSQQVAPDGGIYTFTYTLINPMAPTSPVQSTVVTDPLGNQTTYRFNPQGYIIQATDATGQSTAFNRAPGTNLLLSVTGNAHCPVCGPPGMGPSSYTYDANGNMLTSTDALGNTTTYTYDPVFNQVTSVTDPLSHTSTYAYDSLGDLTSATDANGHKSTFTYNANGLLLTATDPLGNTTSIAYDQFSNPVSVTDPLGNLSKSAFDLISRLSRSTDPQGRSSLVYYDPLDRITSAIDGSGNSTQFTYDAVGNLTKLTDPRGNATSFAYDVLSRISTRTSPLSKSQTYQYDLDGNLTQFTDRRGQVSRFQYDALNRLSKETYQDGSTVSRVYDPYSRLLTVTDSVGGLFGFTYDANGSLLSQSQPTGVVTYTRDALQRVATRQVAGQGQVTYSYDPVGNLLAAAMPSAGLAYSFDARNLPVTASRTNGVTTNASFDPLGRVLSLAHVKGSTTLNSQSYVYDPAGNVSSASNSISQPLITPAATATVDQANELLTNASTTYTYDANGNRLTETSPSGTLTYVWDSRNRLSSITDASGNTTVMKYDFARNLQSIMRSTGGSTTAQEFVVDSLTNVVALTDIAGLPVSVLTGRSVDSHYASVDSSGNIAFGIGDNLGGTTGVTSSAGSLTSSLDYEPYGQTTGIPLATYPFAYAGRVPVLGNIYYYRNRFYDSGSGRFLSEDPLRLALDPNLYHYAAGDPVADVDPSGLMPFESPDFDKDDPCGSLGEFIGKKFGPRLIIGLGGLVEDISIGVGILLGEAADPFGGGVIGGLYGARIGAIAGGAIVAFGSSKYGEEFSGFVGHEAGSGLCNLLKNAWSSKPKSCPLSGNDFGDKNLPFAPGPG